MTKTALLFLGALALAFPAISAPTAASAAPKVTGGDPDAACRKILFDRGDRPSDRGYDKKLAGCKKKRGG